MSHTSRRLTWVLSRLGFQLGVPLALGLFGLSTEASAQCQTVQTASGGTVQSCDGGSSQNNSNKKSSASPQQSQITPMSNAEAGQLGFLTYYMWLASGTIPGNDPYGYGAQVRSDRARGKSSSGTSVIAPGYTDTDFGGGTYAPLDLSTMFKLGPDQTFVVGGFFNYNSLDRDYETTPALRAAGISSAGSQNRNIYSGGGYFRYDFADTRLFGLFGGSWGDGDLTDHALGGHGSFDTNGYEGLIGLKHQFALAGNWREAMATIDQPGATPGGRSIGLDFGGYVGTYKDEVDSFTENTGFRWGPQQINYGFVGGEAKLFAVLPGDRMVWIPFVSVMVTQEFDRTDTLKIPEQTGTPRDVINFDRAKTFWGGQAGLDVAYASGLRLGASGFLSDSSDLEVAGGRAYVIIPFGRFAHTSSAPPAGTIK